MWLWRVTVAFAFFHCNSRYKLEVLTCVVDMCFAKYFNFLTFTCLSVVQNETEWNTHTNTQRNINKHKNANTNTKYTKTHKRANTQWRVLGFISFRIFRFSLVWAVILHTQTQKPHTNTHTHTNAHTQTHTCPICQYKSPVCQLCNVPTNNSIYCLTLSSAAFRSWKEVTADRSIWIGQVCEDFRKDIKDLSDVGWLKIGISCLWVGMSSRQ